MYGELPAIETTDGSPAVHGYPVQILNPPKTALLRLPTAADLIPYLAQQRSVVHDLGRRQIERREVPNPEADMKLFEALRIDKRGEPFDADEAARAIDLITRHTVDSCERDGNHFIIVLKTVFGACTHTVEIPMQRDLAEYRRNMMRSRELPHGIEEHRFPPEASISLYDKTIRGIEGYASANGAGPASIVPPHHKRSVVLELLTALALLDPSLDPNS